MIKTCLGLFGLGLFIISSSAQACGPDSDCRLGERSYRVHLPENFEPDQPKGAIFFAHGYRGSAKGVMRNQSLRKLADELGVALIALNARGHDWHIDGVPSPSIILGTDEFDYVGKVLDDAKQRFDLDPARFLATGFSAGGMLIWNLACHMSERFQAFAPISGTFWQPVPAICQSPPANLIHIHGTSDKIVPLQGRPIADTHQGDVHKAFQMYASFGAFEPASNSEHGGLSCSHQQNPQGKSLSLCLFDGGHSFRTEFVRFAWNRLIADK